MRSPGNEIATLSSVAVAAGPALAASSAGPTQLKAVDINETNFARFGQVIEPTEDGKSFDERDAQLVLGRGPEHGEPPPRLYIMRLPHRGRRFSRITFHAKATQCLGCLGTEQSWILAVAAPTLSLQRPPGTTDLVAFRIPPGVMIKLERGTWHAGEHMNYG